MTRLPLPALPQGNLPTRADLVLLAWHALITQRESVHEGGQQVAQRAIALGEAMARELAAWGREHG